MKYENCTPGDRLAPMQRFRATWAATRAGADLPVWAGGADLAGDIRHMWDGPISATRWCWPISNPAVAPGDHAATLAVQISQQAANAGATVAELARALQAVVPPVKIPVVTMGPDLQLVTLARYETGAGSVTETAERTADADAASDLAEKSGLAEFGHRVLGGFNVIGVLAVLAVVGWIAISFHPGRAKDWL